MDVKKTILKYVKILKLQFNSSQTAHAELLRKPNKILEKGGLLINKLKQSQIILLLPYPISYY